MSVVDAHLRRAEDNRSFRETIPDKYPNWIVTAVFYEAVHYIEALLVFDGHGSCDHDSRFDRLRSDRRYSHVRMFYNQLFNLSVRARYEPAPITDAVSLDEIHKKVIGHLLKQVRQSTLRLLGRDPGAP